MTIELLSEPEAIAHAKAIMAEFVPDYALGAENVKKFWIEWTDRHKKTLPKVDVDTGEIVPAKEYRCTDCDVVLVRVEGTRGRMPSLCPECKAKQPVVGPIEHFCTECETQLFRPDGSATGKGRWATLCPTCKGS